VSAQVAGPAQVFDTPPLKLRVTEYRMLTPRLPAVRSSG
jgi:hypothetical protein